MPSPFPGVDPFVEGPDWEDFHHTFITELKTQLVPLVRPKYVVRTDLRVYQQTPLDDDLTLSKPDVGLYQQLPTATLPVVESPEPDEPLVALLPMPEEIQEAYITLRRKDDDRLVTVIEILSPSNKRAGSTGRAEYLQKRDRHLVADTHLVEIDLLRGGERLPMASSLPLADYYVFVSRGDRRPECDLYRWTLRQKLPSIRLPLADGDPDIVIDLQRVFTHAYDVSGYDYSLDYARVLPSVRSEDAGWIAERLATRAE